MPVPAQKDHFTFADYLAWSENEGENILMQKKIERDGVSYPVVFTSDKIYEYANVEIKGKRIKGRGDCEETAFWDLNQKIYQQFDLSMEGENDTCKGGD